MRYANIFDAFEGSVWHIDEGKLQQISTLVENILNGERRDLTAFMGDDEEDHGILKIKGSTAIIEIRGTLFKRANMMTRHSGATSFEMIQNALREAASNRSVKNIVLHIDSGGGTVHGTAETAALIREIRAHKNVVTVFSGLGASAAYFIGSAANTVYASPSALVGNIGTVMVVRDISKLLDKAGIKFKIFRSAPLKGIGNETEPLSAAAVKEFQRLVDTFSEQFIQNVALNLNISIEEARKMADARVHMGQEAVELGFVDGVKTLEQVLASLDENASFEDKFNAIGTAYETMREAFDEFQLAANEKFGTLVAGIEALKTKQESERIDAAVAELCEGVEARFPVTMKDRVRKALENDFEASYEAFKLMPVGAGAPSNLNVKDVAAEKEEDDDPVAHAEKVAAEQDILVAYDEEQAKIYTLLERKFVEAF